MKEDFPFLPSGCQVRLDKQTQDVVLENLKSQIANRWAQIVAQLRRHEGRFPGLVPGVVRT